MSQIVNVTIDFGDVDRGFDAMARRGNTLGTVFQALKVPAKQDLSSHAARAMGRDGPWPRRSVATAMKAEQRAAVVRVSRRSRSKWTRKAGVKLTTTRISRVRRLLGTLPTSTRISVRGNHTLVEKSAIKWADVHNSGGVAGRGAVQPRREFLWFSDRFLEVMRDAIELHVIGGWDPSIRLQRLRLSL